MAFWITALLALGLFQAHSVSGQNGEIPACYTSTGVPQRCIPPFVNAAYGLGVEATNTCGQNVVNDETGRRYHPDTLENFRIFYRQTGSAGVRSYRDWCDATDRDPKKRHEPSNMVDLDGVDNTTWWQSVSLFEFRDKNLGAMVQSTITINLGKAFDITYVRLRFHSSRPESFAIFKRTDETSPWEAYQFYSASCRRTYGLPQNGIIDSETRAICTGIYSDIVPLSGGNIVFSALADRPGSYEFENSPLLQEWVTATSIKIELTRINTYGDEVFEDTSVLQSYYYAISDISIGGKCKCNGHARECVPSTSQLDDSRLVCRCEHSTTGPDCGQCLPFYNNKPWFPATSANANVCEQCNCNGRSERCYFDHELYQTTGGDGGHCLDCRDFTDGPNCERCRVNYFRSDVREVCQSCDCDEEGSVHMQCNRDGKCSCKAGVTGDKCDRCDADHYNFGTWGCRACGCVEAGSYENTPYCNNIDGQCACKENVEGQNCDRCKPGFFNLDLNNKLGCLPCYCNGKTSQCVSALGYNADEITSDFTGGSDNWAAEDRDQNAVPVSHTPLTGEIAVAATEGEGIMFLAPDDFLGNQKYSYDQFLTFSLRIGEQRGRPSPYDIILEGNGRTVYTQLTNQDNPEPSIRAQTYTYRLNEHRVYQWSPSLTSVEFHRLLNNLTAIKIKGTYNYAGVGFIDDVSLGTAYNGQQIGDTDSVERCSCPSQYVGQFCESCAPGYRREVPFGGSFSDCVLCECNGHSDSCQQESGECICEHNTTGVNCEKCKVGFYGNALTGKPDDCQACPCPNQGACSEHSDGIISCLECPKGYAGDLCDVCTENFFGVVSEMLTGEYDECQPCDCNTNVDANAVGNCNTTSGVCLKCIYNTGGDNCETCLSGFYGNATADIKGDCKECDCNPSGTDPATLDTCELETGQCSCLPYVTGRQCDQCERGSWNLESATGCEPCLCDPVGSYGTSCDLTTGKCECKPGVAGKRCDQCEADFYGFTSAGCSYCNCTSIGVAHGQCDDRGQCVCSDTTRITGQFCTECLENKHNLTAGCVDCPHCYNLVQDAVTDIRQGLVDLALTLENINDNPNVDDDDFVQSLDDIAALIEDLHQRATNISDQGGPVSDDLKQIFLDLLKLKVIRQEVLGTIETTRQQNEEIDVGDIRERTELLNDKLELARDDFSATSSLLISRISGIINELGQKSDNMTALARESGEIRADNVAAASDIVMRADEANEIAKDALDLANKVISTPGNVSEQLAELQTRLASAQSLLTRAQAAATLALEESGVVLSDSLSLLEMATRAAVEKYEPFEDRNRTNDIQQQAIGILNDTRELEKELDELINQSNDIISQADLSYNSAYSAQQDLDALLAEADVALQMADDAVQRSEKLLRDALEILQTLLQFDQLVKNNTEDALAALGKIEKIEELLDEADNKTAEANQAVNGANAEATEAQTAASDALQTASAAAEASAQLLSAAQNLETLALEKQDDIAMWEQKIQNLTEEVDDLSQLVQNDSILISSAREDVDSARRLAQDSSSQLLSASETVAEILDKIRQLSPLNVTELARLDAELTRLEQEYEDSEIDSTVEIMEEFSKNQKIAISGQVEELKQLVADVNNMELIVATIPTECFADVELETPTDVKRSRKKQRRLRKQKRKL